MRGTGLRSRIKFVHLILAAASLHLLLTTLIYLTGRFALWPQMFDPHGIGILFAADCIGYRVESVSLIRTLFHQGIIDWLMASSEYLINPFHLKIYSLSFAALGPLVGYNILAAEPLNLLYYLSILYLVFALGREVFDERAGIFAAGIIALWPSFLLHTTQLFRDPLFITAMLALLLVCLRLLTRGYSWLKGLIAGVQGTALIYLLWLLRREMWEVMLAIVLCAMSLFVIEQLRQRRVRAGNIAGLILLLVMTLSAPRIWAIFENADQLTNQVHNESEDSTAVKHRARPLPPGSSLPRRISKLRRGFLMSFPGAGSNIDTEVKFKSRMDISRYLPRAALIGFFAPFPKMWFADGPQVGLKGRLLSGFETFIMYIIAALAFFALWHHRRRASVWLLMIAAGTGMTALGLVVANIAALYRLRYAFWMLLIVLAAGGVKQIIPAHRTSHSLPEK